MKLKLCMMLAFVTLTIQPVFSEEVEGLVQEFLEVEDYLSNKKISPEQRKKNLEKNLLDSVKSTLSRKIKAPAKELKELKISDINYERPKSTNKFYVKYKTYYIYYSFTVDPEVYLQTAIEEILYVKPPSFDQSGAHKEETASLPDTNKK
jgi:hypothetical protein